MSFEKSVKGGTKIKLAAPKSKYVEHILTATRSGEAGVAEIFRTLTFRLRDSTWTIVFKALIIVHLMIREGEPEVTLRSIADSPSKMAISNFSDAQIQGGNIRRYYTYLMARAKAYQSTHVDWARNGQGRLGKQTIEKGLLRETETVQKQLSPLLKCDLFSNEPENEISLTAFRLLVMDLLALFKVMNEGMVNILEHYFEMSKTDAERSLSIYKMFCKQTELVVSFLQVARQFEGATRLEIPVLKHAPTTLVTPLQDYIDMPDFEINRRQFLAERESKKSGKTGASSKASDKPTPNVPSQTSQSQSQPAAKAPAPDLMDFFDSIEQNQQPMQTQPQQGTNPYNPFAPQHQQQQQPMFQGQPKQQTGIPSTNPFAQMVAAQQPQQPQQQSFTGFNQQQQFQNNPHQLQGIPQGQEASFAQQQQQQQQPFQNGQPQQQPFQNGQQQPFFTGQQQQQPFFTGQQQQPTTQQQPFGQGMQPQPTGQQSTNPFRASMMPSATGATSSPFNNSSPFNSPPPNNQQQSTNPFARNTTGQAADANPSPFFSAPPTSTNTVFNQQSPQSPPFQSQPTQQPLQSTKTGTNPFARSAPTSAITSPIVPQQTGTNPFRQSAFVNQQTGQGWQNNQGTMGGLEQLNTIPVFPRPAPQGQQPQPWP